MGRFSGKSEPATQERGALPLTDDQHEDGQIVDDGSDDSDNSSHGGDTSGQKPGQQAAQPNPADKSGSTDQSNNNNGDNSELDPGIQGNVR